MALSFDDSPKTVRDDLLDREADLGSLSAATLPTLTPSWVYEPKRGIEEVATAYETLTYTKVEGAEVCVADYDLIRRDFPALNEMSNSEIDRWLVDQVAYISEMQLLPNPVNTDIPVALSASGEPITREVFRPEEPHFYGRACVIPVDGGLIDVKGSGCFLPPSQGEKLTGLMPLSEGLREYALEKAVSLAAMKTGLDPATPESVPFKTVGSYAVIELPFEIVYPDGTSAPVCLYLRQAHDRASSSEFPETRQLPLESTLREFGVTATEYRNEGDGTYGGGELGSHDVVNLQVTKPDSEGFVAIYDYGSIRVRNDLDRPLKSDGELLQPGMVRSSVIPDRQLPGEIWSGEPNPLFDNLSARFHHLAVKSAKGEIGRSEIEADMSRVLDSARSALW